MMMQFIPGMELNQKYYVEIVAPLLKQFDSQLIYSASLIGYGSDVLGYDNATSMDHNWGPRMQVFVGAEDARRIDAIKKYLSKNLPPEFMGFPTNFSDKTFDGTQHMAPCEADEINHLIEIYEIGKFFDEIFHKQPSELTNLDWLCITEQKLVELTSGRVFYDGLDRLEKTRSMLKYYPREVKLAKLAAYWDCISNEEPFVGRRNEFNDLLGVKLISTRMVNVLLKICFVLKETYVPYSKWFTRKFDELNLPQVKAMAVSILMENDPKRIEEKLADLYIETLKLQNRSSGVPKIEREISSFYNRPYKVIMASEIVEVLRNAITDEQIKQLDLRIIGIDNKIDSNDFTDLPHLEKLIRAQ